MVVPVSIWSIVVLISLLLGTVLKALWATAVHPPTSWVDWAPLFRPPLKWETRKISSVRVIKSTTLPTPLTPHTLPHAPLSNSWQTLFPPRLSPVVVCPVVLEADRFLVTQLWVSVIVRLGAKSVVLVGVVFLIISINLLWGGRLVQQIIVRDRAAWCILLRIPASLCIRVT